MTRHPDTEPGSIIGAYLSHLTLARRDHIRARLALALDADRGQDQRTALAECLFSPERVIALMRSHAHPDPEAGASDLLDRLEGHIVRTQVLASPA